MLTSRKKKKISIFKQLTFLSTQTGELDDAYTVK